MNKDINKIKNNLVYMQILFLAVLVMASAETCTHCSACDIFHVCR